MATPGQHINIKNPPNPDDPYFKIVVSDVAARINRHLNNDQADKFLLLAGVQLVHESDHRELINIQLSQSDLEEKCRRVLELWARRSNSRWEDVILQLRETVGLSRLADELIKELDRSEDRSQPSAAGGVKLDQEILQVIKDAKEKGLVIKIRHSKVLFCGSSKVGKTNFINLLLKKDFEKIHKPTGVAESHQLLAKHCQLQVTLAKGCTLQYMDYKTQITWLKLFLSTRNFLSRQNTVPENDSQPGSDSSNNYQLQPTSTVEGQIASEVDTPPDNFPEVWNMLTFLDTGGQPAFINMLPALSSSAMITFILHSMEGGVDSLTKKVTVYGDGPKEYSLDYNYIDLVKMLFSMRKPKELQMFEQFLVENDSKGDKNCYLSLVGTKSDLCDDSVTVAKNISKKLKPIIDQTIHKSSLIPIGENYFVPVSNCKANTEDEDPVAAKFRSCIFEYLEKRDMFYIPIVWLILELEIINKTKQDDVIHFDDIFKICKENALITNEADVRTALQFFHHVGIFLYYGSDDSDMKNIADIVITNYQWIFKNLAAMVKAAKSDDDVTEDFRCNGLLNKNVIKRIDWKLGKGVGEEYFLKLLDRLSIISVTKRTHTPDEYFMPCVLPTFSFDTSSEQDFLAKYGTKGKADSLLMQLVYEKSSCHNNQSYLLPRGVFCCVINQLLLNHPRFKVQWSDGDSDPCVFNNLIVLYDEKEKCFVALIDKFMYLKVEVLLRKHTTIGESSYHDIKVVIGSTLKSVCDKFMLDISRICIGFLYSDDKLFWAQENYDKIPKNNTIYNRNNNPKELEESQKVWFLDQCSTATTDALSTTLSSAADTTIIVPPTSTSIAEGVSAFIVYAKEENDPGGDQALCLSNLLIRCGIVCDIDLYHTNDNILDWSSWVENKLKLHIASQCSFIIMVCSPTMFSTLEERNDSARVEMAAAYINRLTLRYYLQQSAQNFLPLYINDPSANFIPPNLSGKTCYHFPYNKLLSEIPESTAHEVLDHPDFTSLRSLVATLTGQQEIPTPRIGSVPQLQSTGRAPFTGANTTSSSPMQQGTNHTVNSSTKDEGLISHDELERSVNKISIDETNDSAIQNTIQILLVTANKTEYGAALTFLDPMEGFTTLLKYHHVNNRINKHAIYIFGKFGYFNAAVHLMTQQGPAAAQDVVTVAADCFGNNLNAIFAVGVACGVEGKCKMLDVLVSKTISSYIAARIGTNSDGGYKIENRSTFNMQISSFLQTYFDQPPKWPGEKSIVAKLLNKPTQLSGNILSGHYLIDNMEFKQKLLKYFAYDAIGIEMEGAGFIHDYPDTKYKIMVIKAVCDFGNGKKDKTYQPTAAVLAVECLKHCIGSSPYIPQKLAEFCGNKDQRSTATTDVLSTTLSSAADTTITVPPTSTSIAEAQSVTACSQHSVVQSTSQQSSVTVTQQGLVYDVMSADDHPVIDGKLMHKHVIPRISGEWETVAAYLEYSIPMKKSIIISKAKRGLPRECCTELLEDWISSNNGVKPKTWEKFMDILSEISSLAMVTKEIKQCLCQEGVLGGQRPSQRQEQQVANHQPVSVSVHQQSQPTDELQRKLELQKEVFTNCWQYIIQYLSPDDIVDHLISEHLIGNSARQKLSLDKTKDEKNRIIVDELCSGGPDTFEKFCVILKKNSITKHIANRLENEWRRLLESSQINSEQLQYTTAVHTKVTKDKKERKIPKESLRYTLGDLILQTKDKLEGFDNNTLDKHSNKAIINGVRLLLMVVNSSEFYAAMNYFSRSEAKKLESDGDIYYVGKWGKISAALVQQSRPGIAGPDGSQQLTIASINLFKNLEVIIALGVCATIGRLGDVIVSSQIDGCDNIKIVGNNIQIINRGIKANPGRKIYKHLKQNHDIWSFVCTTQETEIHEAKAVIKPMLSGVPLVASAEYREKLKESVNLEAEGLEMEGIGVIHGIESAQKKDTTEFIIVKAGCDYADEYKSKEWQPVAAMAAADFVYYQLSKPNWLSDIT